MAILYPATFAGFAHPALQAFPKLNAKNFPSLLSPRFPINFHLQFLPLRSNPHAHVRRLHDALSPQPPPQSDPPPEMDPVRPKGMFGTLSGLQDRVQIFLAVLFWMSLFFWSSAWGGRSNGSGRPNKGSRFRK